MAKKPKMSEAAKLAEARRKKRAGLYKSQTSKYKGLSDSVNNSTKVPPMSKRKYNSNINVVHRPMPKTLVKPLPDTPLTAKGVSLAQLMRESTLDIKTVHHEMVFRGFKEVNTKAGFPAVQSKVIHKDPWRPQALPRPHECVIMGRLPHKKIHSQKVMCSCNCEDWVYRWEYAAALHGGARIVYGNGQPPRVTNPSNSLGLCKHLYALALRIKENKL